MFPWSEKQLQTHTEIIYDSVTDPNGWRTLIEKLVTDLDLRSGHISLEALDQSGIKQRFSHGISDEENQLIINHFHKIDPWTKALTQLPTGRGFLAQEGGFK
jgi:hypothetical protein